MGFRFIKRDLTKPPRKTAVQWTSLKNRVKQEVDNDSREEIPFDDVINAIKSSPPSGWTPDEITEGIVKEVAQQMRIPHR